MVANLACLSLSIDRILMDSSVSVSSSLVALAGGFKATLVLLSIVVDAVHWCAVCWGGGYVVRPCLAVQFE